MGLSLRESVRNSNVFRLNLDYDLTLDTGLEVCMSANIKNIYNSFQKNLQEAEDRNLAYIYGAMTTRTVSLGMRISNI